ncbi:trigger factor [Aureicoccus marinus]|jgi:trigger factor|uniref:Trigger factor n=1 Tax=Aureicoccus marinus TaxID=754435 RepID=A0A2S7T774_9FLAO|nr:trigger factor [Aureicoccus marinus]PQJ15760.1 trigger factor [Aureicoccus marinus]
MNITKEQIDDLNAVVTVAVSKEDYQKNVDGILQNYRKQANIPGFRKGQVPIGLIRQQYGKAVLVDEVNKLLQDSLNTYLKEEKLDVLGNPLPRLKEDFDWDQEPLAFEFELGLAPSFDVKLKTRKSITHFQIKADKKEVDQQMERIQKQYGKLISKNEVTKEDEVTGSFRNAEEEIEHKTTFEVSQVAAKKAASTLVGAKPGDIVKLKTKGLFKETYQLAGNLGVAADKAEKLNVEVDFEIEEVNHREAAELNQELFDKIFGPDQIHSEQEMRDKIVADSEAQFVQQSDQKLLNDITERLIEQCDFKLPNDFLKKWIQASSEEPISDDQAKEEYEKSEKGIRYQLIEAKIIDEHGLSVSQEELIDFAKGFMKSQMAQYGHMNPSEEELSSLSMRILGNPEEAKRLSQQLMSQKLLELYKKEANLKVKEVSYENFIKEAYGS